MSKFDLSKEPDAIRLAAKILQTAGWTCYPPHSAPGPLLTPIEIAKLAHLKTGALHRRLHSPRCPAFYAIRGATGRILRIKLTQELEAYLRRPLLRSIDASNRLR